MASLADILATVQQGVTAANALVKQMTGTLNNISGQFNGINTSISSINTQLSSIDTQLAGFEAAWTPYSPAVTPFSGSIVVSASTGRYHQIGKTTFVQMTMILSSGGAGSGLIYATLPFLTNASYSYTMAGRETLVTGKMLQGFTGFTGLTSALAITNYDNSYPGGNGYELLINGIFEST
jgi:hypothetical protein